MNLFVLDRNISCLCIIAITCAFFTAQANEGQSPIILDKQGRVTFDQHPIGPYTRQMIQRDLSGMKWARLADRAHIVNGKESFEGKSLRISYPRVGKSGGRGGTTNTGAQIWFKIPPRDEYYLQYHLKFGKGFDFKLGGKLPGLAGGRANTGGKRPTGDGWSTRYMFRPGGKMVAYVYHMDQVGHGHGGRYADDMKLGMAFIPGQWYRLTQRVKVNTGNDRNGILQVWVDGKLVLNRRNIRFRNGNRAQVDHFLFETFHGGPATARWAPDRDSFAYYDDIIIHHDAARMNLGTLDKARSKAKKPAENTAKAAATSSRSVPEKKTVTEKAYPVDVWAEKLRGKLAMAVKAGKRVKARLRILHEKARVRTYFVSEVDADCIQLKMRDGNVFPARWKMISRSDRLELAVGLAHSWSSDVETHILAAFFSAAEGIYEEYDNHIRNALEIDAQKAKAAMKIVASIRKK